MEVIDPKILLAPPDFQPHWREDMNSEQYHADRTAIGSGNLRTALDSLKGFYYAQFKKPLKKVGEQGEEEEHFRFGKVCHKAVLEGDDFRARYIVEPVFTGLTKKGEPTTSLNSIDVQNKRAQWYKDLPPDRIVVTEADQEKLIGVAENLLLHPQGPDLFQNGQAEVVGYFRDEETGLRLKFMPDFAAFSGETLVDLKTAKDSRLKKFGSAAFGHRYDVQLFHYATGMKAFTGKYPSVIANVVVEKTPPYEVAIYYYLMEDLFYAEQDYRKALNLIRKAIDENNFPPRQTKLERIYTPVWFMREKTEEDENATAK